MRRIAMALAGLAIVFATSGAAVAQGSGGYETRAEFIYQLDVALGIAPVYPPTSDFQDVPRSDPYYGYIEAAYQKGIVSGLATLGLFGPYEPLTRAQAAKILVEAYGAQGAAQGITATNFSDSGDIPTSLVGYVGEAAALGLMQGVTPTVFAPRTFITEAQVAHILQHLHTVQAGTSLQVTASATDVAPGEQVTLTATGTAPNGDPVTNPPVTYAVQGANASQAVLSGSTFAASTAGDYVVQASLAGATASVKIAVYGTPAVLSIKGPAKPVVANGASQQTVTVEVLDGNGNVVANSSDLVQLTTSSLQTLGVVDGAGAAGGNFTLNASHGVATFTVQSGTIPGATATLTAQDQSTPYVPNATLDVATVVQQATSLTASAQRPYLEANGAPGSSGATYPQDKISVQVLDQVGEPMLEGTTGISATLTGPALFDSTQTTAATAAYTGNGSGGASAPNAVLTLDDVQAATGIVTVTVTAQGLQSATVRVSAVIAGPAAALQLVPPASTSFSEDNGATGLTYGVQAVDRSGYPVALPSPPNLTVTVLNAAGTAPANIFADGLQMVAGGVSDAAAAGGQLTITDDQSGPDAGAYTVQVSDPSGALAASSPATFTETAGAMSVVAGAPSAASCNLLLATNAQSWCPDQLDATTASPSVLVAAQLTDAYGNPVAIAGVPIVFDTSDGDSSYPMTLSATAGGILHQVGGNPVLTVPSDDQGRAYVTMTGQGVDGTYYYADLWSPDTPQDSSLMAFPKVDEVGFAVTGSPASQLSVQLKDTKTTSITTATAGDPVTLTVTGLDQYGNPVTTYDDIHLTFSGAGTLTNTTSVGTGPYDHWLTQNADGSYDFWLSQTTNGVATLTFTATKSGPLSVTATDVSLPAPVSATAGFDVQAGPVARFALIDSAGNDAVNGELVTANQPIQLTLTPEDAEGNPTVATHTYIDLPLNATPADGEFRLTEGGSRVNLVTMPIGSLGIPIWYVDPKSEFVKLRVGLIP